MTQKLNIDKKTFEFNIEPFLVRHEFIKRTQRGRIIDNKGKEFLNQLGGIK